MQNEKRSYRLRCGAYEAEILGSGATLARLSYAGRDLITPATEPEAPPFAGALLAPWPNRTADGRYTFAGQLFELERNEASRGHAIHGLAHSLDFAPRSGSAPGQTSLSLESTLEASPGYPWKLLLTAHFTLGEQGLSYGLRAENLSEGPAPYGAATHPYLVPGPGTVADWNLELAVSSKLQVAPNRMIPTHLTTTHAFSGRLDDAQIDHAFTEVDWASDGTARARLRTVQGTGVEFSWDQSCPWVQVFTSDFGEGTPHHRAAVAIEPMTCAPDAFNDTAYAYDTGLIALEPGHAHSATWGIAAI